MQYIPCPKHEDAGIDFSPDGTLMAVILRQTEDELAEDGDGGDVVGLYGARSQGQWNCLHRCSLGSNQTADVKFSRDGAHLIVWDDPVQCSIQIL